MCYLCSGKVRLAVTAGNVSCKKEKHQKLHLCNVVLGKVSLAITTRKCFSKENVSWIDGWVGVMPVLRIVVDGHISQ